MTVNFRSEFPVIGISENNFPRRTASLGAARRRSSGGGGSVDGAGRPRARAGAGARPAAPLAKCRYPWAGTPRYPRR